VRVRAPAKLNLVLRVGPLRSDGYHQVSTLLQAIDLCDEIELEPAARTTVEGFPDDTLVRAALDALGETRAVRITKRIPVAAGLGGGSADAGAVLRALGVGRTANELHEMARAIGADVPFFLSGCETAIGTGRGDRIQALPDFPRGHWFLLVPSEPGLSAAEVYARVRPNDVFPAVHGELVRRVHTARDPAGVAAMLVNELEPAVLELRPQLAATLRAVRAAGALGAAVSGSGPTVFGVFGDRAAAERAAALVPGSIPAAPLRG
jgi:4-diphosphocytidyl-2-C-methyl-D-erythritol kinase